jgi:hypothetical protein
VDWKSQSKLFLFTPTPLIVHYRCGYCVWKDVKEQRKPQLYILLKRNNNNDHNNHNNNNMIFKTSNGQYPPPDESFKSTVFSINSLYRGSDNPNPRPIKKYKLSPSGRMVSSPTGMNFSLFLLKFFKIQ